MVGLPSREHINALRKVIENLVVLMSRSFDWRWKRRRRNARNDMLPPSVKELGDAGDNDNRDSD